MKYLKNLILLAIFIGSLNVFGQKPDNISFEGYFKNQPKLFLPDKPYTVKYAVSEWFNQQIAEKDVNLELKGYKKGNGYTLIFLADDPELKDDVIESFNLTTKKNEYKAVVTPQGLTKIILLNDRNERVYEISFKPHLKLAKSEGLGVKATQAEAEAQNKENISRRSDYMKNMYVKEVMNEYQDTLDNYFGKFNKQEKFRMALIKAKNFNYDDFNGAVEKFKTAVSTPEINMDDVNAAIEILGKCKQEYAPGKKTRICDLNIDELYLNLVQAYLVKSDYENAKQNWDKCNEIKGNRTAEAYVKRFFDEQLEHVNYYPISEKNYSPIPLASADIRKSNSLFFNLFLSLYLTELQGETRIIQDYFPLYIGGLQKMEAVHSFDDYLQEKLNVTYDYNGLPVSANYTKTEEDESTKYHNFEFKYDNYKISSVIQNNSLKYKMIYDGDKLSEIQYRPGQENAMTYIMDYSNPEKIGIKVRYIKDGKARDSMSNYYVKFNDDGTIKAYFIDVYSMRENIYDSNKNWIGIKGVNESTGNEYETTFKIETDQKGNLTKRILSDRIIIERKLTYL